MINEDRVYYQDDSAIRRIANYIMPYMSERALIFCVGSDKCIGDSIGPLVGTLLEKSGFPYPVIGTLDNPVHAVNITECIKKVEEKYPGYFIVAIDACLGHHVEMGYIKLKHGPINPGAGIGKTLPKVGNISICAVVDDIDHADIFSIRSIRLSKAMHMAETITAGLIAAIGLEIQQVAVAREV